MTTSKRIQTRNAGALLNSSSQTVTAASNTVLEINGTIGGGGVLEILYSSVPFLNNLRMEVDWEIINGDRLFIECTKTLHNLQPGARVAVPPAIEDVWRRALARQVKTKLDMEVVIVPDPAHITRYLENTGAIWLWRCHINMDTWRYEATKPEMWDEATAWIDRIDAAFFASAQELAAQWPVYDSVVDLLPRADQLPKGAGLSEQVESLLSDPVYLVARYHVTLSGKN